ncbi:MAG: 4Fe-4S binding protein [Thermodesulfobacteriota bacterium]|nr:4Fe-4S binding protein [Thermodesulfobacteriota bacterium]
MNVRTATMLLRRISQLAFLVLFLFLFRKTDYTGTDTIPYAVNIFFRWDPLVAASVMLAAKTFIALLLPALFIVLLTLVFGRAFCGWICPLGTLIDSAGHVIKPVKPTPVKWRAGKYIILAVVLIAAAFGVQLIGFADPFAILVRGATIAIDPLLYGLTSGFFNTLYFHAPAWVSAVSEPVYSVFKETLLPYKQGTFYLPFLSFAILAGVFLLEFLGRRFWCRNLCPLGGMLALISRFSFFRRIPLNACKSCQSCKTECRMTAFGDDNKMMAEECNLCMDCLEYCPDTITRFRFSKPKNRAPVDLNRRHLVAAGLAGLALPFLSKIDATAAAPHPWLIRPPGALPEEDFLKTCVRCGECMKVCIQNALQPVVLEQGLDGMFTPRLVPRLGYCEFNCTLCGQVCPTGAIQKLSLKEKQSFIIGRAYFDKNRCLPYADQTPCIVCEEHCPTHDKAIKFREKTIQTSDGTKQALKQPYIVNNLCIGCGICEARCPLEGNAAVRVIATTAPPPQPVTGYA